MLQVGRGGGRRSAEVPIVGGRRVGTDGEAGHSVWLSDALCQVPWGPQAFLSTLSSGPVCFPSVSEGSLSLPPLRLPGGWVVSSTPYPSSASSAFLDQLVLSLQGPTRCREKQAISFVSNWCCTLIQQLLTGMLTQLFNKLLHSPH